jgi:hypothetical protein
MAAPECRRSAPKQQPQVGSCAIGIERRAGPPRSTCDRPHHSSAGDGAHTASAVTRHPPAGDHSGSTQAEHCTSRPAMLDAVRGSGPSEFVATLWAVAASVVV